MAYPRVPYTFILAVGSIGVGASGQTAPPAHDARTAPALVREGNKLLNADKPAEALRLYQQAESKKPDVREIDFVRGLGHYKLGEYEQAREAFQQAAAAEDASLSNDALYSVGTCDHAEALASAADPKAAMGKLESAMQSYQSVLSRDPKHEAARESNLKAATMWRQIKQQLEQQQQQQQQQQNDDQNSEEQQQDQEKQQQESQEGDQQEQQPQSSQNEQQQKDEQQTPQEQKSQQDQAQEKQSGSAEQQESEQQAAAEHKPPEQQVSREQAERQLREMIESLKDRAKLRQEQAKQVPVQRADKDW